MKENEKKMKEYRKQKKALTENLVNVMKSNEIDCSDIQNGQLIYTKQKNTPLSKKHLFGSLTTYFKNDKDMVEKLSSFIMDSRGKIKENIDLLCRYI